MKRVPELRDLSDDHHTGLMLARRCLQAARADAPLSTDEVWRQVLETFSAHLEPHFLIEERVLLPGLESIGELALASRIRSEHEALRAYRDAKGVGPALVAAFGKLLESHIRFEEREVFERTQDRLPAAVLSAIAEACRSVPRACLTAHDS